MYYYKIPQSCISITAIIILYATTSYAANQSAVLTAQYSYQAAAARSTQAHSTMQSATENLTKTKQQLAVAQHDLELAQRKAIDAETQYTSASAELKASNKELDSAKNQLKNAWAS